MIKEGLTFDDVLLVPKFSILESRSRVDLSVKLCKGIHLSSPIIPANMKDIVSEELIEKMYNLGALSFLHRFSSLEEQCKIITNLKEKYGNNVLNFVGASVGVKSEDKENIDKFINLGIKIVCIDIAHLDSILGENMIKYISNKYPSLLLVAGNVATAAGAERAWKSGADIIKCGIGAGSICSTRLEAGHGVPQLTAIMDIHSCRLKLEKEMNKKLYFISDGGHKQTADCVKSLCFADMVMLGSMIAGVEESPGTLIETKDGIYKSYHGSSTHKKNRIEGVKAVVKFKGPLVDIIKKIHEGIQSGCSYQGSMNLEQLKLNPEFIKITNAGLTESKIHDVVSYEK